MHLLALASLREVAAIVEPLLESVKVMNRREERVQKL